jgi:hypothetical protein
VVFPKVIQNIGAKKILSHHRYKLCGDPEVLESQSGDRGASGRDIYALEKKLFPGFGISFESPTEDISKDRSEQ